MTNRSSNNESGILKGVLFHSFLFVSVIAVGFIAPILVLMVMHTGRPSESDLRSAATEKRLVAYRAERNKNAPPERAPFSMVQKGEQLYSTYCIACHQAEGMGKVGMAPYIRNRDFLALASDDFLRKTIMAGRPGTAMTPWSHLPKDEIEAIIAYLRNVETSSSHSFAQTDPSKHHPGDASEGKNLYAVYCSSCHGVNATGYAEGVAGPGIGNQGFLSVAPDDYIFQTVKHGRRGTPMRPFMGPEGLANLNEKEVGSIIAYLRSDRTPVVTAVASSEPDPKAGEMHFNANCVACHQPSGVGKVGVAPSIRNRDFLALASDDFIKETVKKGRPGTTMIQRPDLTEPVMNNIIAYLRSVDGAKTARVKVDPTLNLAEQGDPKAGHGKFSVYCATCHGVEGKGYVVGGSGPAIGLPGFLSIASDDYIFQTLKRGRIGTAMRPFFGAQGLANLDPQDAFDIISYLRNLNEQPSVAASDSHTPNSL